MRPRKAEKKTFQNISKYYFKFINKKKNESSLEHGYQVDTTDNIY